MDTAPRLMQGELDEILGRARIIYCYALLSQRPTSAVDAAPASGTKAVQFCLTRRGGGGMVRADSPLARE